MLWKGAMRPDSLDLGAALNDCDCDCDCDCNLPQIQMDPNRCYQR
jgi:hypothetical protein